MAMIRLPEDAYKALKEQAKRNYRTIGGQIEYLLYLADKQDEEDYIRKAQNPPAPLDLELYEKEQGESWEQTLEKLPRTAAQVLKELNLLQKEVDQADPVNQDPDYWETINEKKIKIQSLWDEWHGLEK